MLAHVALKLGHFAPAQAKHVEKLVPERLGFGVFAGFVLPLAGKGKGALADFGPG
ncbi:MAG: hypothetical protein WKG07_13545 [Hymenobacter sp.]